MPKRYWWVLATYVIMQLSAIPVGLYLKTVGYTRPEINQGSAIWGVISFCAAFIVMLVLLRRDMATRNMSPERASSDRSILWAFLGILMAYGVQIVANMIEMQLLGVDHASANTKEIMDLAKSMPIFIFVVAIIGPILEEIVFRKVIFGSLYKRYGFAIAAVASSLLFGLAHMDISFLLTYTALGVLLCFLYWKTKRIIVPMVAHATMNTLVVVMQFLLGDQLQKYMDQVEKTQALIWNIFS